MLTIDLYTENEDMTTTDPLSSNRNGAKTPQRNKAVETSMTGQCFGWIFKNYYSGILGFYYGFLYIEEIKMCGISDGFRKTITHYDPL